MSILQRLVGIATEVEATAAEERFAPCLIEGERIGMACELVRDAVLLTNLRLIQVDMQGLTGAKTQFLSIPWSRVNAFAVESAGTADLDSELKLWVSGMSAAGDRTPSIECKLARSVDSYAVQRFVVNATCRGAAENEG